MIEIGDTDVNIVRNCIPMRNCMPASAYGLKAISDWFRHNICMYDNEPTFFTEILQNILASRFFTSNHGKLPKILNQFHRNFKRKCFIERHI